jgi:5-methylcytosine-specific restriction protein A
VTRREFDTKTRVEAYKRCGAQCEICTAQLSAGNVNFDHRIADGMGGKPTLENCQVLCRACHAIKTRKEDVPAIARAKRREMKFLGVKKPSRGGFRAWRRFDGTVVRRRGDL